ncbi:AAA family ATPase [Roseivirga seohaensis]|uniref:ATPase AAA n=2 Tax=Roseivirga seohaensis TaxID=1914963 RepID=A0A0L8AP61_9BACT|nr:MoxR family ATPase [Roseivirga seohaensis]KOF03972.1 ATPase AAA [Roseivirga seohaensis subsp. aquiponti]KYG83978.1 AAA family ATPase [Roseivirga seohaensis]
MEEVKSEVALANKFFEDFNILKKEISKVIIGQDEVVNLLLTSIFCQGHSLLVGVPGLAKTLLISTISSALDLKFNRIQFTPDLMPSDILGAETLDKDRNFKFIQGPIFANIILADEINRTPPKTQAALLEAMQEYAVTVAGQTFPLQKPFFVLATQNPIEQEGTYPLPEAQLDRFLFNIQLSYPSFASEVDIVKGTTTDEQKIVNKVLGAEEVLAYQHLVRRVPVADNVIEYAVNLVHKTRFDSERAPAITKEYVEWGAGPRASQNLIIAAKCNALLNNKYSPDIEDVKAVAKPILRHRIVRNFKAEAEGITIDKLIEELL